MYSLDRLFMDSTHKGSLFSSDALHAIENAIYTKTVKGVEVPCIQCLVRGKEIRLTPEEAVRQLYIYTLVHEYGYSVEQIELERHIHFGREVKRADIVLFEKAHPNAEYIIIEVKKPRLSEGKEQLKSYCNATGATMGVWTNGQQISYYHRKDPNYFEDIPNIPTASQKLKDILTERWTIDDLVQKDKLVSERKSLKGLIEEMEDEVLANAGVDVFEEVFKLIYTKLYDEMQSGRDRNRNLEFRNYGDTDEDLKTAIQGLFEKAKEKWPGVFASDAAIALTPSHLSVCVSSLQDVKLFNSNLDVVDDAFEYLMSKSQKGEKGQFFTPRYVIDMCVRMLNPKKHETMIDPASGSCGFPVHTTFYVWKKILEEKGIEQSNLFTTEKKPPECEDYVNQNVFAIDFDEKAVRVARTLNLIAGDGRTNVLHLNTLDYERWDEVTKDEAWQDIYLDGWSRLRRLRTKRGDNRDFNFDIVMANPPFAGDIKESRIIARYELGKNARGSYQSKVGRDILFIERNLCFLKPGGRMAIILPQGRFNNSSDKYIRDFIAERCRILAVVGLHGNVFKPHTGTKTSVLFVQKWDDELCPKKDDYPIFFATMQRAGKDNSGDKIFRTNNGGQPLLDEHGHMIVDHDLYNHDGLTEDGIAEAFAEFAKREGFSFFNPAHSSDEPFNEARYKALMNGLECSEVMLSNIDLGDRIDAEYFAKRYLNIEYLLDNVKTNKIGELSSLVASAFYPAATQLYSRGDIAFVRCVDCIDYPVISKDQDKRFEKVPHSFVMESKGISCLRQNEIVITKVGTPCYASIITEYDEVALSRTVLGLTNIHDIDPFYLMVFLRCRYGFGQLHRQRELTIQYQLTLQRVKDIDVFVPSETFQAVAAGVVKKYCMTLHNSDLLYKSAQQSLADALHFDPSAISNKATTVKSLSASFGTSGRLDAEYYQPKYDDLSALLNTRDTVESLCHIYDNNFTPAANTEYRYIELANVGLNGTISGVEILPGKDLPSRARRQVKTGQTIISSIEGSLRSCAMITDEYNGALCSTGFYVLDSERINPETLLLLFQSEPVQALLKQRCSGTILAAISKDELRKMPLPLVSRDVQLEISDRVRESFALRRQAEKLIDTAVKAVEIAIEQGEDAAASCIKENVK